MVGIDEAAPQASHSIADADANGRRVTSALAVRSIVNIFRVPGAVIPTLVMPIFFMLAFAGSFSGLARGHIVPTHKMIDWVMPYAILQGCAFAGMGSTFSVARDLEGGFYDRLLLAPVRRESLIGGPVIAAMLRGLIPIAFVLVIGTAGGARPTDGLLALVPLTIAALGVAAVAALWGLGVAYRFRSQRSMSLVQIVIFVAMFLSAAQVPVRNIQGWLHNVARVNPVTNILRLAREGYVPTGVTWQDTWGGLLAIGVMFALMGWWASRGFRKLIR